MKLSKLLSLILIINFVVSCKRSSESTKTASTTIQGSSQMSADFKKLKLYKMNHGELQVVDSASVDVNNNFQFNLVPESEGFYHLRTEKYNNVFDHIPLYIKKGQTFNIELDSTGYNMSQIPDKENELLSGWVALTDTLNYYGIGNRQENNSFEYFFPFYEQFSPKMQAFHKKVNTKNTNFNRLMHAHVDMTTIRTALSFLYGMRGKYPKEEEIPDYYSKFMAMDTFKSATALEIPEGMNTLRFFQYRRLALLDSKLSQSDGYWWLKESVSNDTLRAYVLLETLKRTKALNDTYHNIVEKHKNVLNSNPFIRKQLDELESKLGKYKTGEPGYNFMAKNIKEEQVSFNDFKGKYVYIDIWATWCGPCKAEIPHIQKLEKEFHGKDIEFVSVSVDKSKDKDKWKTFVKDNHLTGIQLIVDNAFSSEITKEYGVNSIPRFLLFDQKGKVIDIDAKRPSNPELKTQLEQLLN